MRLYLLPVSTRRTLLYCQRAEAAPTTQTWVDKIQSKAARTWAGWEKQDGGWKKKVVEYGNYAFRRIPYEEWGLKSVPPLSAARRSNEVDGKTKVEVVYPGALIAKDSVPAILHALSTSREPIHRKRMIWCFVGMPISAPFALLPVVPNLPFFYLVYRAWSHWRALAGGRHIQFLLQNKLLNLTPSPVLDQVYIDQEHPLPSSPEPTSTPLTTTPSASSQTASSAAADGGPEIRHPNPEAARGTHHPQGETMLLSQENGRRMTQALDLPQLEVELERAIWQVETAIKAQDGATSAGGPSATSDGPPALDSSSADSASDKEASSSDGARSPEEKKKRQ